ncbi:MAG: hypothetical protein K8T20_15125 [Planctomycetes bacterium]|nr:hypothetical protein [Planctomycetota bacterium]
MKNLRVAALILVGVCTLSCQKTADPALEKQCHDQLGRVGIYLSLYEAKYHGYPTALAGIEKPDLCSDMSICHCPFALAGENYAYRGNEAGAGPGDDFVLAYDATPHPDGFRHVVYVKNRVNKLNETDFKKALEVK